MSVEKENHSVRSSETSGSEISTIPTTIIYNTTTGTTTTIEKNWTPEEEAAAYKKLDFTLIPLLFFAFFLLQLDRGNIANALTSSLREDVGLNNDRINAGTALFNVAIVIFEIPANVLLQKFGPSRWLGCQVFAWSLVATLQALQTNYAGFLVTRFFMGALEGGFIPGALYYISTWYTKSRTTTRYNFYFLGNVFASACSGLIAAGILKDIAGAHGLPGWKWIFIIEGSAGLGYGIIFFLLLPESPSKPYSVFGYPRFLSPRDSEIIQGAVLIDDPEKINGDTKITAKDIWDTFKQWRVWLHFLYTMAFMQNTQALSTYIPSIVKSLGWASVEANAMASVGLWGALVMLLILTRVANYIRSRGIPIMFLSAWQLVWMATLYGGAFTTNNKLKYAMLTLLQVSSANGHVLNTSWLSMNMRKPAQRSVALALVVMSANLAGICAGQILRQNDLPLYRHAFLALMILSIFSLIVAVTLYTQYVVSNKKLNRKYPVVDSYVGSVSYLDSVVIVGETGEDEEEEIKRRIAEVNVKKLEIKETFIQPEEYFRYKL